MTTMIGSVFFFENASTPVQQAGNILLEYLHVQQVVALALSLALFRFPLLLFPLSKVVFPLVAFGLFVKKSLRCVQSSR